jgi:hypothetical protein
MCPTNFSLSFLTSKCFHLMYRETVAIDKLKFVEN